MHAERATERAATFSRRRFMRHLGTFAAGSLALPLLAACTGTTAPVTPPVDASGTPTETTTSSNPRAIRAGSELHLLLTSSATPAADDLLRILAFEWGRDNDVAMTVDFASTAAIQRRLATPDGTTGLDIVGCRDNLAWRFANLFSDSTAEAVELAGQLGDYYPVATTQAQVQGVWRAVPFSVLPSAVIYRTDWLQATGAKGFPSGIDEFLAVSKVWKKFGHPFGAAAGRSTEDPRTLWHNVLWNFGGRITEADGKTIAINSPETVAAVEWAKQFWTEGCLAEGLLWDDNGNNLAYSNAQIAATVNSPGLYLKLKQENRAIAAVSALGQFPAGPAGQAAPVATNAHAVLNTAPNASAARAFLLWLAQPEQTNRYLTAGGGAIVAALRSFENHPLWSTDPHLRAFLATASTGRWIGWPAPPSQAADDTAANFIVVDMFAQVFAGKNIQMSINDAVAALRGIYPS